MLYINMSRITEIFFFTNPRSKLDFSHPEVLGRRKIKITSMRKKKRNRWYWVVLLSTWHFAECFSCYIVPCETAIFMGPTFILFDSLRCLLSSSQQGNWYCHCPLFIRGYTEAGEECSPSMWSSPACPSSDSRDCAASWYPWVPCPDLVPQSFFFSLLPQPLLWAACCWWEKTDKQDGQDGTKCRVMWTRWLLGLSGWGSCTFKLLEWEARAYWTQVHVDIPSRGGVELPGNHGSTHVEGLRMRPGKDAMWPRFLSVFQATMADHPSIQVNKSFTERDLMPRTISPQLGGSAQALSSPCTYWSLFNSLDLACWILKISQLCVYCVLKSLPKHYLLVTLI